MRFENIRVSFKLAFSLGGLMLLMFLVALWAQQHAANTTASNERLIADYEQRIATALEWAGAIEAVGESVLASNMTPDADLTRLFDRRVKQGIERISELQARVVKHASSDADRKALDVVQAERTTVQALNKRLRGLKDGGDMDSLRTFVESEYLPGILRYTATLQAFIKLQRDQRDMGQQQAAQLLRAAMLTSWALQALVFVLGLALAFALTRSITKPLQQALSLSETIAQGDLTAKAEVAREDEFGLLLRAQTTMAGRLRQLVSEVHGSVNSISLASQEIAAGNQNLSSRTEQTASNLEETAASMEELTSTVAQSADNAVQASRLVHTAVQAAEHGVSVVGKVIESMQQITDRSRRINDIIGVIDSIAFQTNILALNAAVEAARAGEQGRGFAVVAGEVRTLAQRSAEAAKEIKHLITDSVNAVNMGSDQVNQAGEAITGIESSVRKVTDLISEISAASAEQRDGIGQVNQAVNNLDQMTQQNAALVEESAAAASALHDQAMRLLQLVQVFKIDQADAAAADLYRQPALAVTTSHGRSAALPAMQAAAPQKQAKASALEEWDSF